MKPCTAIYVLLALVTPFAAIYTHAQISPRAAPEAGDIDTWTQHQLRQSLSAGNTAERISKNRWYWTVFIQAADTVLDRIGCVEYQLHPTFPVRIKKVCDRGSESEKGFSLRADGWGEFTIKIKVFFKNTHVVEFDYRLLLKQ